MSTQNPADEPGSDAQPAGVDGEGASTGDEPTSDLERGMKMSVGEVRRARNDPEHPLHAAAEAAMEHLNRSIAAGFESAFGQQLGRIAANLDATLPLRRPDVDFSLGLDLEVDDPVPRRSPHLEELMRSGREAQEDLVDAGAERALLTQNVLDAAEVLSELVRVASEHRDVAIEQATTAQEANENAQRVARNARTAAWVAAVVAFLTLLATVAAVWATLAAGG